MKLLVISNGHGEDIIAVKIIQQLKQILPSIEIACLPMVGKGFAYQQQGVEIITAVKSMPSGGFVNMDRKQLWSDIRHGLIGLTIQQYQAVRAWVKKGGKILAVGDILPLLVAWLAGGKYFFVGTAKSEYYRQDENGWLEDISLLQRYGDSVYYPWECWLMKNRRCLAVFPRDNITTLKLQKLGISAQNLGNPMIDDLSANLVEDDRKYKLKVLLLPGSRIPEAIDNWQLILQGIDSIIATFTEDFVCLGAIAPSLSLEKFETHLSDFGWEKQMIKDFDLIIDDPNVLYYFRKKKTKLVLSQQAYNQCLNYCNLALATAGTATEQFVGLGKCAIVFPGFGPQYNLQFAQNQKRLLGKSLQLLNHPQEVGSKIQQLLSQPSQWQEEMKINGKKRLGEVGASLRIAQFIKQKIL